MTQYDSTATPSAGQRVEDIDANLATLGRVERVVIHLSDRPRDEGLTLIVDQLSKVLDENDGWTLILQGMLEEIVRPGGCLNLKEHNDPTSADYAAVRTDVEAFVADLEERLAAIGILAYADGEAGTYTIEVAA